MKISTRGRYGLRAVIDLAMQEEKGCVSLAEIAARQDISFNYLESIFSYLRRAGIVIGTAGSLGGYTLSKTAVEMNLYDILKVLEGELSMTGSEEPENETDLRDKYNTVLSLLVYKSDKKALSDLIAEAKKLDKDHYTIETWQNFEKALENAESIYDGNVPQDEVDLAKEALEKAKNELLEKNKKELSVALEMAKQVTPEQLDKVVPAVVTEFKAALENAQIIFDKKDANELEINKAFERLSNVMQMLEFYKGDKTQLSALVEKIEKLNKNDYLSATWKNLESVLTTAKDVLNNPDALEIEVSETHDQLVRTFLQLRLKPNKDLLSELINKAENTDQTKYTAVSLLSLKSALVEAKAVLDNNEATQDEVTAVEILLKTALDNLVVKEITLDDPNAQTPPDAKPGNGAITATKTGDDSMMLTFALAGLLALAGSVIVLKKKEE